MKILVVFKLLLAFIVSFSVVLIATWVFLSNRQEQPEPLPSSPEGMVEQFLQELSDHNYDRATDYLSEDLSQEISMKDLQHLVAAMEAHEKGIVEVSGSEIRMSGEELSIRLDVKFISGVQSYLELPIVQEDGVWKISSIDSLWGLILSFPDIKMLIG